MLSIFTFYDIDPSFLVEEFFVYLFIQNWCQLHFSLAPENQMVLYWIVTLREPFSSDINHLYSTVIQEIKLFRNKTGGYTQSILQPVTYV